MAAEAVSAALVCAGLGAWLDRLLLPRGEEPTGRAGWHVWLGLSAFAACAVAWAIAPAGSFGAVVPAQPGPAQLAAAVGLCAAAGAAAFRLAARRHGALMGVALGACWGFCAYCAKAWLSLAAALRLAGFFAGPFLAATIPWLLGVVLAALAAAALHDDLVGSRVALAAALLVAVSAPASVVAWRLRAEWDYGPRTLEEAASLPPVARAPEISIAWLRPSNGRRYRIERRRMEAANLNASLESLEGLFRYLERRQGRSLFAAQALTALRRGWLQWWDADRALEAAFLSYGRRSHPDYRTGLALLRGGELTAERYAKLEAFEEEAGGRRAGFEDVNQSQLIFEAFSAAFARFGDEERARRWIYHVDSLWPIYDKKVEITPIEYFRSGRVRGSLALGRGEASRVRVALFFIAPSTTIFSAEGTLGASQFPDADGRFAFSHLGAGRYYLGLMAAPTLLGEPIQGAPGLIEVSPEVPEVDLEPIRLP